jgi:TonB-dependent SusC/RagA subfamily outer membrane receptor
MKKIFLLLSILSFGINYAQKPIFISAKAKAATVYFNGATLEQSANVNLPKGNQEIVIKNVADFLNENTIQIGAPSTLTILSVQFTQNYISEYEIDETNPAIKQVRDSINIVNKEIKKLEIDIYSHQETIALLDENRNIKGNAGISVAELVKLTDYYKAKRIELDNAIVLLTEKKDKFHTKIASLQNKLQVNTQKEEKASKGKIILLVMNELPGTVNLDIKYLTQNAYWYPYYDLRANSTKAPIELQYKAKIHQTTGIDWKQVKLSLSSGNPNQNNDAPNLNPWFLSYGVKGITYKGIMKKPNASVLESLQGYASGFNITSSSGTPGAENSVIIRGVGSISGDANPLYILDGVPISNEQYKNLDQKAIKSIDVLKDANAIAMYGNRGTNGVIVIKTKNMDDYTSIEEQELNVTFDIDLPYDILSNGKAHSVGLKTLNIPAKFKYYAIPKLDKEAFLLAEITDYGKYNILPGEANIIFEDIYVGKTNINPNQTQDTINLSMGRDKKISIKKELVADKSGTKFLSSYKEQTFTYDIIIRNNKKESIVMQLKDQFPLSTNEDITIELLESSNAKVNKEKGILDWEIKLDTNETKKYRISYKVKHPKDKYIGNL